MDKIAIAFVALAIGAAAMFNGPDVVHAVVSPDCRIKGNVSYNNGRRIYHMPGQKDYATTRIAAQRGERWFCSEQEARAAGWTKAGR